MKLPDIKVKPAVHRNKKVLQLIVPFNREVAQKVRLLLGVFWSRTMNCWYIPDNDSAYSDLEQLKDVNISKVKADKASMDDCILHARSAHQYLLIIRHARERIKLFFRYDAAMVLYLKTMPLFYYDAKAKWWTLPHLESVLES